MFTTATTKSSPTEARPILVNAPLTSASETPSGTGIERESFALVALPGRRRRAGVAAGITDYR